MFSDSFHQISFAVETPPFMAVEFGFIWTGRNPVQIQGNT